MPGKSKGYAQYMVHYGVVCALCAFCLLAVVAFSLSAPTASAKSNSKIAFDAVRIECVAQTSEDLQVLGDAVEAWDVGIANNGTDCWVRVRALAEAEGTEETLSVAQEKGNLVVATDGWVYVTDPIGAGALLPMSVGLKVLDGVEDVDSYDVHVNFEAQAIQARNVTPDWTAEAPWGDVEPVDAKLASIDV